MLFFFAEIVDYFIFFDQPELFSRHLLNGGRIILKPVNFILQLLIFFLQVFIGRLDGLSLSVGLEEADNARAR